MIFLAPTRPSKTTVSFPSCAIIACCRRRARICGGAATARRSWASWTAPFHSKGSLNCRALLIFNLLFRPITDTQPTTFAIKQQLFIISFSSHPLYLSFFFCLLVTLASTGSSGSPPVGIDRCCLLFSHTLEQLLSIRVPRLRGRACRSKAHSICTEWM